MGERNFERASERTDAQQELSFNQVMDVISMEQSARRSQLDTKTVSQETKGSEAHTIDFSEDVFSKTAKSEFAGVKTTYHEASNAYLTDDGYILPLGSPRIERLSGYELEKQLKALDADQAAREKLHGPEKSRYINLDPLVVLPDIKMNYGQMASGLNGRSLYAPPSNECSETSVFVDGHFLNMVSGGMNIYDEQNENCRLAQTVKQSCAVSELLALETANAGSVDDVMKRSDAVKTATDYCAETIDAVKREQQRLKQEDAEDADDED